MGGVALIIAAAVTLQACDQKVADTTQASQKLAEPITVKHALGTTVIDHLPQRVAVLDMNEADFLDQLNVPIMGMPKDYVPHFLEKYKKMHKFRIWVQLYNPIWNGYMH